MTGWSDIISNSAMVYIDDLRLTEQLAISPARFYRRMALFVQNALPLMSRPPELLEYLQSDRQDPLFADYDWTSTEESTTQTTVLETGLLNYDLCSVCIQTDDFQLTPYPDATYDPATGNVTFPIQEQSGIKYQIDFYTDGEFAELTATQMRLFGLAIAVVWDERFDRDWLADHMKIKDASFQTVNESNYIEKKSDRTERNRRAFNDELRKYEQDIAYSGTVPTNHRPKVLL